MCSASVGVPAPSDCLKCTMQSKLRNRRLSSHSPTCAALTQGWVGPGMCSAWCRVCRRLQHSFLPDNFDVHFLEKFIEREQRQRLQAERDDILRSCRNDRDIEPWRALFDDMRDAVLVADRQQLLQVCEAATSLWACCERHEFLRGCYNMFRIPLEFSSLASMPAGLLSCASFQHLTPKTELACGSAIARRCCDTWAHVASRVCERQTRLVSGCLQVCELLLRQWLPGFLQARSVDVSDGEQSQRRVTTLAERHSAAGAKFAKLIDPNKHPSTWFVDAALAVQLDAVVNRTQDESSALSRSLWHSCSLTAVHELLLCTVTCPPR